MRCTDEAATPPAAASMVGRAVALLLALLAGGCSQSPEPAPPAGADAAAGASAPRTPAAGQGKSSPIGPSAVAGPARRIVRDPASGWDAYRRQAAERIVALNPGATYAGPVPEPLLAIPVLEIELAGDGSVRHIGVLRQPGQAADTVQLAIAAVRRAAPFGSVAHLPRPWKFTETFLFDDQRRFKPRSLDT